MRLAAAGDITCRIACRRRRFLNTRVTRRKDIRRNAALRGAAYTLSLGGRRRFGNGLRARLVSQLLSDGFGKNLQKFEKWLTRMSLFVRSEIGNLSSVQPWASW